MSIVMKTFSKILKELRIGAGLTQKQLAEKLNIRQQSYARYENGEGEPNLETLVVIANIFDVPVDYLLGNSEL